MWTLGQLVRLGNQALRAFTPENFDQYAGVVDAVATWTRWHDVFIHGDDADRAALLRSYQISRRSSGATYSRRFRLPGLVSGVLQRGSIQPGARTGAT